MSIVNAIATILIETIKPTVHVRRSDSTRSSNTNVSVHVTANPYHRGLTIWQWGIAGCTALLCLLVSLNHQLLWFLPYGYKGLGVALFAALGFAIIKFPTGRQPLRYIRFLGQAPPLKPAAELISGLPNEILHLRLFGEEKIAIACEPFSGRPTINDQGVRGIAMFLSAFADKCTFVCTTGRPDSAAHPMELGLPHCVIMCDAGPDASETAARLWQAFQYAGLQAKAIHPSIFEATAGHGLTSSHFIVERLPYSLPLGWLGDMAMASCDFTTSVTVRPADLQRVRAEASQALQPRLSSHAPSLQELDEYVEALAVRDAARDLLDGKTMPFELSVDISICSDNAWSKFCAESYFRMLCGKHGVYYKHVRDRVLPFSASFHEPPAPYDMTVTKAAAVACCPFFVDILHNGGTAYRRSERNKFLDLFQLKSELVKLGLKRHYKL